jgi:hypothetical protein
MRPKRCASVTVQDVGDEVLVLNRTTNELHHLNVTASWVFRRCDGNTAAQSIIADLVAHFAVEPSVGESDVMAVLEQLRLRGLIAFDDVSDDGLLAQEMLPVS